MEWNTMQDNVKPTESSESAGDMLRRMGIDAQIWAQEFIKLVPGAGDLDEYDVIAWMANAIGAGEGAGYVQGCLASDTARDIIRNAPRYDS